MRMRIIARAIMVALVTTSICGAQTSKAQTAKPQSLAPAQSSSQAEPADTPEATIEFVHPQDAEKVTDYPLFIQVNVHNFKLLPPVSYWARIAPEDMAKGHIHYTLDDSPIYATSETQIMLGKNGGKSLPVGRHVLKAELVYMNHKGLTTPAVAEISFLCERPNQANAKDSPAITNAGAQKQLQQIQQQIEQVQKQILQLQKPGATSPQTVPAP